AQVGGGGARARGRGRAGGRLRRRPPRLTRAAPPPPPPYPACRPRHKVYTGVVCSVRFGPRRDMLALPRFGACMRAEEDPRRRCMAAKLYIGGLACSTACRWALESVGQRGDVECGTG